MDCNEMLSFFAYCIYASRVTVVGCVLIERGRAIPGVCRASDGLPRYNCCVGIQHMISLSFYCEVLRLTVRTILKTVLLIC